MKRYIAWALLLPVLLLSGCEQAPVNSEPELSVVCTIFPLYDWTVQILGESHTECTLLSDNQIDLHSYQPSVEDIVKISNCDIFIYVGGESDGWVEDALKGAVNPNMVVINLLERLGDAAKMEETVEGMEDGHDHDEEHDEEHEEHEEHEDHDEDHEEHDHEHEGEYDEHIWLSLKNAQVCCAAIAEALSAVAPDNADRFQSNLAAYTTALSNVDADYRSAVETAPVKTLLVGDRFPYRYLADDYGLDYYAAFAGCSAETEASFETVIFLAGKADELGLNTILVTESTDQSIANTIRDNTATKNQQNLVLDSLQSTSAADAQKGITYLSVMESNLKVLKEALGVTDVDIDLTMLSSTMVYAEVYNMMEAPENYLGKTIKIEGMYYSSYYDVTDTTYHFVIIEDATACCQSGLEFKRDGAGKYPEENARVGITGIFDRYEELGQTYYYLATGAIDLV